MNARYPGLSVKSAEIYSVKEEMIVDSNRAAESRVTTRPKAKK